MTKKEVIKKLEKAKIRKGSGCYAEYSRAKQLFQNTKDYKEYEFILQIVIDYLKI